MEDPIYQFVVRKNGVETLLSEAEARKLLSKGANVKPALYGSPRTKVGDSVEGLEVFSSPLFPWLILEVGEDPDRFMPKGTDYEYKALPGIKKPTGANTDWYGNTPPADFVKSAGYRLRYIRDKKTGEQIPDQIYYEQSDEADEVLEATRPDAARPDTSTNNNAKPPVSLGDLESIEDYETTDSHGTIQ
jgi:hypothetical protein